MCGYLRTIPPTLTKKKCLNVHETTIASPHSIVENKKKYVAHLVRLSLFLFSRLLFAVIRILLLEL